MVQGYGGWLQVALMWIKLRANGTPHHEIQGALGSTSAVKLAPALLTLLEARKEHFPTSYIDSLLLII
jgi:hypothetical protein